MTRTRTTTSTFEAMVLSPARKVSRVRVKWLVPWVIALLLFCNYMGVFTHFRELDYYAEFSYPLEGDIQVRIESAKQYKMHCFVSVFYTPELDSLHEERGEASSVSNQPP